MMDKQFDKNLPKYCKYCVHGNVIEGLGEVLCIKRGITLIDDTCRKYKYDPLKREPNIQKISDNFKPEDFLL